MKIPDYPCKHNISTNFLNPQSNVLSPEEIAQSARDLKQKNHISFCMLPFEHTLEAAALTGSASSLNHTNIKFHNLQEILSLPSIDLDAPEITAVLHASSLLLSQGEKIVFQLSGPLTILNHLLPLEIVFLEMIKHPQLVLDVFSKLGNDIVLLAKLAESYGIQIFSYADPCAGVTILGPKRLKMLTSTFTFPLLKQLDAQLNSQDVVVLCPKTALALIASELAVWKEHPLPQMTTYTEALFSLQEQIRFCGQTCINQNPSLQRFLEIKLTDESSD